MWFWHIPHKTLNTATSGWLASNRYDCSRCCALLNRSGVETQHAYCPLGARANFLSVYAFCSRRSAWAMVRFANGFNTNSANKAAKTSQAIMT